MSQRIKGNALSLAFAGTDYWADLTSYELDNEEASSDVTTFADAASGGARQHFLSLAAIQSTDTASFWRRVWSSTGQIVAYRLAPHGNEVATPDKPHFIGTCKIGPKPKIGGEAGETNAFSFETRFDCQEEPILDTGAGGVPLITLVTPGKQAGELAIVNGSRFTGTTGVTIDGTATEFEILSDTTIAILIDGAAEAPIVVTNAAGASAAYDYEVAA